MKNHKAMTQIQNPKKITKYQTKQNKYIESIKRYYISPKS